MNSLTGHIAKVQSEGNLSLVTVALSGDLHLEIMVIDTPESADYLENGREIEVLFKETELILASGPVSHISIQNHIPCTVDRMDEGELLTRIYLNSEAGSMTALLPASALSTMQIREGDSLTALVKFNEIMLSTR